MKPVCYVGGPLDGQAGQLIDHLTLLEVKKYRSDRPEEPESHYYSVRSKPQPGGVHLAVYVGTAPLDRNQVQVSYTQLAVTDHRASHEEIAESISWHVQGVVRSVLGVGGGDPRTLRVKVESDPQGWYGDPTFRLEAYAIKVPTYQAGQ